MAYYRRRYGYKKRYRYKKRFNRYKYKYHKRRFYRKRSYNKSEVKFYDQTGLGGTLGQNPTAWSMWYLTAPIVQGLTDVTRTGNSIRVNSYGISFDLLRGAASTSATARVRCMVIYMKNTYNSAPTAGEIFQSTNTFMPQRDLDYMTDYRIVYDRVYTLDTAYKNIQAVKFRRKTYFKARYSGNGGTFGDQTRGGLYLLMWSDQASNGPTVSNLNIRTCFSDP